MVLIGENVEAPAPPKPWGKILVAVLIVALIGAGIYWLATRGEDKSKAGPSTNILPTGEASVDLKTATREVAGFPRGYPQTETGAVESFLGWSLAPATGLEQPNNVLEQYYSDVMPRDQALSEARSVFAGRSTYGINESGVFVGPTGSRPFALILPEYGAFRSEQISPEAVEVEIWAPTLGGVGSPSDTSDVVVVWAQSKAIMRWRDGDWRLSLADAEGIEAPTPRRKDKVNVSFSERKEILGEGWKMFDGASQVWPAELLGEEPR